MSAANQGSSDARNEPPVRRRLYLVRHGDVDYFDEAGRPHRPDLVPLNAAGRDEAAALARLLEEVELDRVVSSDLPRAVQTADIIAGARGLEVEQVEAFREIRPGRLADLGRAEIEAVFLGALSPGVTTDSRFLGGERFGEFVERVLAAFRRLLAEEWRELLLVAHGAVNRAIILDVLGAGLQSFGAIEQDPAALNILDFDGDGQGIVRLLNATPLDAVKRGMRLTTMERLYRQYRPE